MHIKKQKSSLSEFFLIYIFSDGEGLVVFYISKISVTKIKLLREILVANPSLIFRIMLYSR